MVNSTLLQLTNDQDHSDECPSTECHGAMTVRLRYRSYTTKDEKVLEHLQISTLFKRPLFEWQK